MSTVRGWAEGGRAPTHGRAARQHARAGAWPTLRSGGPRRAATQPPAIARGADGGALPPGGVDF
eukprot:6978743-Pyramimonas_sp.AAC.1